MADIPAAANTIAQSTEGLIGSIVQSTVRTKAATPVKSEPRKRHHSDLAATPNKPSTVKRHHRKNTEDSEGNISDIEELPDSDTEVDTLNTITANTRHAPTHTKNPEMATNSQGGQAPPPHTLPGVRINPEDFAKMFINLMKTEAFKKEMVLAVDERFGKLQDDVNHLRAEIVKKDAQIAALQSYDAIL